MPRIKAQFANIVQTPPNWLLLLCSTVEHSLEYPPYEGAEKKNGIKISESLMHINLRGKKNCTWNSLQRTALLKYMFRVFFFHKTTFTILQFDFRDN